MSLGWTAIIEPFWNLKFSNSIIEFEDHSRSTASTSSKTIQIDNRLKCNRIAECDAVSAVAPTNRRIDVRHDRPRISPVTFRYAAGGWRISCQLFGTLSSYEQFSGRLLVLQLLWHWFRFKVRLNIRPKNTNWITITAKTEINIVEYIRQIAQVLFEWESEGYYKLWRQQNEILKHFICMVVFIVVSKVSYSHWCQ